VPLPYAPGQKPLKGPGVQIGPCKEVLVVFVHQ